uniref:Invertebrate defensins family profile domain-containing protein n=1 Tax=Timema cristinae TaxID=61476 RepID=A0A7R9DJW5_TIMCR|nr:unnamed protein product [Timema cristinae]
MGYGQGRSQVNFGVSYFCEPLNDTLHGHSKRVKRFTCYIPSFGGSVFKADDVACSAQCVGTMWFLGYLGGSCQNGTCVCRK